MIPWLVCGPSLLWETSLRLEVSRRLTAVTPEGDRAAGPQAPPNSRSSRSCPLRTEANECSRIGSGLQCLWAARLGAAFLETSAPPARAPTVAQEGGVRLLALPCHMEKGQLYLRGFAQAEPARTWFLVSLSGSAFLGASGSIWRFDLCV